MGKSREQRRGTLFYSGKEGVGGAVTNQVPWSNLGGPSPMAVHWLSYDSFPLAGLLLVAVGRRDPFLPPAGGLGGWGGEVAAKVVLTCEVCLSSVGSAVDSEY